MNARTLSNSEINMVSGGAFDRFLDAEIAGASIGFLLGGPAGALAGAASVMINYGMLEELP